MPLFRPRRPTPPALDVDATPFIVVGTAAWAVAFVVVATVPGWRRAEDGLWLWTCVAGTCLGLVGIGYVRRLRARRRR